MPCRELANGRCKCKRPLRPEYGRRNNGMFMHGGADMGGHVWARKMITRGLLRHNVFGAHQQTFTVNARYRIRMSADRLSAEGASLSQLGGFVER